MQSTGTGIRGVGDLTQTGKRTALVGVLLLVVIHLAVFLIARRTGPDSQAGVLLALGGIVASLVLVLAFQRKLGLGLTEIGLRRPDSWPRTILLGVLVAVISGGVAYVLLTLVISPLTGAPPPDVSRFDAVRGKLGVMIGTVVTVWLTSAFPEEVIWRGFLMTRIAKLGGGSRAAWGGALVLTSVHFGWIHFYQGLSGMILTGLVGLLYGLAFLKWDRNLWIPIMAHAATHVLSFTILYLGLM